MRFEWDEAKRLTNLRKHGIDFADRIISARKATRYEEGHYFEQIAD